MSPPPSEEPVKLTRFARGSGCGCKIAPDVLDQILKDDGHIQHARLLVGYGSRDDAAVLDMGAGQALIGTTDFFTPVVDDAYDFGYIASVNAMNDVYAMGGTPLMAIGILGWPVEKLSPALAARVLEGARAACAAADIPLAGGHSIDAPEPFFGLAVTGTVAIGHIKRNNTARDGDLLLLTKPLGLGIMATALKRERLQHAHLELMTSIMRQSLRVGTALGKIEGVHAMTDVTGFGLLGHLLEMCDGSGLGAEIRWNDVPVIPESIQYLRDGCYPDGTFRNMRRNGGRMSGTTEMEVMMMLNDPQTSGGLLIALDPDSLDTMRHALDAHELSTMVIGKIIANDDPCTSVRVHAGSALQDTDPAGDPTDVNSS
jgi:selenide, water dikinase